MQYLIIYIITIINSIVLAKKLKVKTEQAIPITIMGMITLVYLSGILGNLKLGLGLIIIISIIMLIYLIIYLVKTKKQIKENLRFYFSPGIVAYGIIYIIFVVLNKNRIFENYDEFNHWGLIIKDMYLNDNFAFSRESVTMFNEYPPFTAIFQYIFLKFANVYSEDIIIIANNILSISIVMPLFKKITWDKSLKNIIVIIPLAVLTPLIIYEKYYFNILVDGMIGILIAYILYQWFSNSKNILYRNTSIIFGMISLALIKYSGFGFLAIVLLIIFIDCIRRKAKKEKIRTEILSIIAGVIISFTLLGLWNFNMKANKQNTNWNIENVSLGKIVNLIFNGKEPDGKRGFTTRYLNSIFFRTTITERQLTISTATLLIITLNLFVYKNIKEKKKYKYYSVALYAFQLIYLIYMLFLYLFLFNEEETLAFSSFERYFGTIFLATIMFHIFIGIENKEDFNIREIIIIMCIILAFLPIKTIQEKIINGKQEKIIALNERKRYMVVTNYKEKLSENDRIYYIDKTPYESKYSLQIVKYQMLPVIVENTGKIEDLKENNYTYLYIYKTNDSLNEEFKELYNIIPQDETMYKIDNKNGDIVLEKVNPYE